MMRIRDSNGDDLTADPYSLIKTKLTDPFSSQATTNIRQDRNSLYKTIWKPFE